jgi:hypothetical protein
MKTGWYSFAVACAQTVCYLTVRGLPDSGGGEFGACAYGYHDEQAAATKTPPGVTGSSKPLDKLSPWDE